ncbi:MAG: hypothetical protein Q4E10_00800 [Porphyromonas sp.]|nr:hypothetical protein [Porphyromonas sp.]
MRYGRGRGVHSPKAYNFIRNVVRPYSTYYEVEARRPFFKDPVLRFIFRVVGRSTPDQAVLISAPADYEKAIHLASPRVECLHRFPKTMTAATLFIVCNSAALAQVVVQTDTMVLYVGDVDVRVTAWLQQLESGIILDAYEALIVVGVENVKYLYRTTF